jgi:hypothetical protein
MSVGGCEGLRIMDKVLQQLFIREATIALALFSSISLAVAQNSAQPASPPPPAPNESKKDSVPPATDRSEATRAGTQEPSSKIQGTESNTSIFVNGALAVPGAPTDVDTVPSKFSARTAADDALPMAAYALRHLTDEQRRGIFQSVNKRGTQTESAHIGAIIGALVPISVALNGLNALPENIIASIPEMRDVMFTTAGEEVLLVNPRTRAVIEVLSP